MVDFQKDIDVCLGVLRQGGLILYPTDTVWGIGCDATNAAAVKKVFELKSRSDSKALIVLVAHERDIYQHVAGVDNQVFNYLDTLQKPTTVIYNGAIGLAENLIGSDGSIAIRICREEFCRHLIKRFRKPIVSTSANISGEATPANFLAINPKIIAGVDYTVHYRQDEIATASSSSIIVWKNGKVEVIRE